MNYLENENTDNKVISPLKYFFDFFTLLCFVIAGMLLIGPIIGIILVGIYSIIASIDAQTIMEGIIAGDLSDTPKTILMLIQAGAALGAFVIAPWFFIRFFEKKKLRSYWKFDINLPLALLLTGVIVIVFMIVDSIIIEWNQNVEFPAFLEGFENWARQKENELADMTTLLTTFDSFSEFLLAFIVIAVLAAIGEEIVFRGLMQNQLSRLFGNPHVGIFIAAFIFSAIHLQFYGFFPRFLLGLLFGYLYYWSGTLWVPVVAHLVNNGFTLIMVYLYQQEITEANIAETKSAPWVAVIISFVVLAALLKYFRERFYLSKTE
ncbi:CPBP family intramembrane glutamic endopeptidase [Mangrovivirga cuniculi]|uniref:CPBP family intramembrane metalloprotease domain-containing protein n=1 Tax=Mangrovivirga cuniculi TaxID=2715131 RepID=A0A4D7JRF1_9BACT|nr:CPBP family intramembrane glutamic endopeptidase [Mangrovivirga cuniculi]QCK13515.1 CPBP family intramembrane metalloprotease domain-containing protein [Mangrovivirga cuniculi]